jgi:hypothetical protein
MSVPLALRRRARLDFLDAILWHEDQRAGLGDELEAAVNDALEADPRAAQVVPSPRERSPAGADQAVLVGDLL